MADALPYLETQLHAAMGTKDAEGLMAFLNKTNQIGAIDGVATSIKQGTLPLEFIEESEHDKADRPDRRG